MAEKEQPIKNDEAQNLSSQYFLHPSDNPSSVIVTPSLEGSKNFQIWHKNMSRALDCKDKLGFVDGTIKKPSFTDPLYTAWRKCNNMVISWILKSLSPQIAQSIAYFDSAKDLWQDLKERFLKDDYYRLSDLLQAIHSIRQGDHDVETYFTHLKILWQELEALRPIIFCSCNVPCSCDLSTSIQRYKDCEYVICFVKGLNDPYDTIRRQILCMNPLPSIAKAFAMIQQQERQQFPNPFLDAGKERMPKKYYCDYCEKQFQDTPADRKRHDRGIQHQQAKARWYDSLKFQNQPQQQQLVPPKPLCFHFINTGFCRFGDSCSYHHPNANTTPPGNNVVRDTMGVSWGNLPPSLQPPPPEGQGSNNVVRDTMGVSWGNLPPSLQPPPEGGYPQLPFVDWG